MAEDPKTQAAADPKPSNDDPKDPKEQLDQAQHQLTADQRRIAELEAQVEHLKAAQATKPKASNLDEYLQQAPEELRDSLFALHKAHERRKLEMIDVIKAAPGNLYPDEELAAMKVPQLERLIALAQRADYSVQPAPASRLRAVDESASYAPMPPGLWDKPKAS